MELDLEVRSLLLKARRRLEKNKDARTEQETLIRGNSDHIMLPGETGTMLHYRLDPDIQAQRMIVYSVSE